MPLKFTGRESQLAEIKQLIQAKQGAVFAVSGNVNFLLHNHILNY